MNTDTTPLGSWIPSQVSTLGAPTSPLSSALAALFARFGLQLHYVHEQDSIPGSYWGSPEAGLRHNRLYAREDTPLHSALHEGSHFLCMDATRRADLDADAGGSVLEECAVCYLSILLADLLPSYGRDAMLRDMDTWGYSFRLGSAARWFHDDADDARIWLEHAGWVDAAGRLTLSRD